MRKNSGSFLDYWGRNHTLFFTTTDGRDVHPAEYSRAWNSWKTNAGEWVKGFLKVLEPQKNGRPHYHNLVGVDFDTKPDQFDWDAFKGANEAFRRKDWPTFRKLRKQYVDSACPELRALWAKTREEMKRYGLGRCEILPIRKDKGVADYIGKYLDKGAEIRPKEWKGVRRVEMDRKTSVNWKICRRVFSWSGISVDKDTGDVVRGGAVNWRRRVGELAYAIGLPQDGDIAGLTRVLGPKWAYEMRTTICTAKHTDWVEFLYGIAGRVGRMTRVSEMPDVPRYAPSPKAPQIDCGGGEWVEKTTLLSGGFVERVRDWVPLGAGVKVTPESAEREVIAELPHREPVRGDGVEAVGRDKLQPLISQKLLHFVAWEHPSG